jgi:hypothetical protein
MATQHKETKKTNPELHEPENLLKAPEVKPLAQPGPGTWQLALWNIADDLDNTGNHWLGHLFREQSQQA